MRIIKIFTLLLAVSLTVGCRQKKAEHFVALPFPNITIPEMISTQQDAADYMAEHFWDVMTDPSRNYPCDSLYVSGVAAGEFEQRFANWLSVLDMTSLRIAEKSVARLYDRALLCERSDSSSNVFETVVTLAEKYLYDPNSPVRNEEYFLYFARKMAKYDGFTPEMRAKYDFYADMCAMNRLGAKAADFRFVDKKGRNYTLYGISSPLTLLFFSNPGCDACLNIINMLKSDVKVSDMIASGGLAVLNIYIDEDLQSWMDYMSVYPQEWYNGFDPDMVIRNDNLYSVRAIPSLYLLDDQKRVIMKDAPEVRVMTYLQEH
jgi:hypothetical protein